MRIITGKYKGRRFDIPHSFKARPTTDFAKENIFNVLSGYCDFDGMDALDLFSGTGSISLELLSRRCSNVVSVELDRDHARFISKCVDTIGAAGHTLIRGDVFKFIKSCRRKFDLIFADPPYALTNLSDIPTLALPLLKQDGILILEHGKNYDFSSAPLFHDHRAYGSVNFSIFLNSKS